MYTVLFAVYLGDGDTQERKKNRSPMEGRKEESMPPPPPQIFFFLRRIDYGAPFFVDRGRIYRARHPLPSSKEGRRKGEAGKEIGPLFPLPLSPYDEVCKARWKSGVRKYTWARREDS